MHVLNFLRHFPRSDVLCFSCRPRHSWLFGRFPANTSYTILHHKICDRPAIFATVGIVRIAICVQSALGRSTSKTLTIRNCNFQITSQVLHSGKQACRGTMHKPCQIRHCKSNVWMSEVDLLMCITAPTRDLYCEAIAESVIFFTNGIIACISYHGKGLRASCAPP
jgi:hypothetical protein